MTTALFLAGIAIVVAGVAMISTPAALVVGGASVSSLVALHEMGGRR